MVQTINRALNCIDTEKSITVQEYQAFLARLMQLLDLKQLELPLNLNQIQKIMPVDLNQLSQYLQTPPSKTNPRGSCQTVFCLQHPGRL